MEGSSSLLFRLGVPQPIECRLPDGVGGVGAERQCVSDQGVVHQRILEWVPERRLSFRMEGTDVAAARMVQGIVETFDLAPTRKGVLVTRTTRVQMSDHAGPIAKTELFIGIKHVHRYVFRSWQRSATVLEDRHPADSRGGDHRTGPLKFRRLQ